MRSVYNYVTDRIEEIKFGTGIIEKIPDFEAMRYVEEEPVRSDSAEDTEPMQEEIAEEELYDDDNYIDIHCPNCGDPLSFLKTQTTAVCPWCNKKIQIR